MPCPHSRTMPALLLCAAAVLSAAGTVSHVIHTREVPSEQQPEYPKVNRDSGYGSPHAAPEGYGAPASPYGAPASSYGVPPAEPHHTGHEQGYPLETGYGVAPGATYTPTGSQLAGPALGLSAFLVPLLTMLGLSLLFPSYVNVQSRKKRTLAGKSGESTITGGKVCTTL